jgi:hypothetical protein
MKRCSGVLQTPMFLMDAVEMSSQIRTIPTTSLLSKSFFSVCTCSHRMLGMDMSWSDWHVGSMGEADVHRRRTMTATVSERRLQIMWPMSSLLQRKMHPWEYYVVNPPDGAEQQPCRKHEGGASCGSAHPSYHMIAEQMNAERRLGMTNG